MGIALKFKNLPTLHEFLHFIGYVDSFFCVLKYHPHRALYLSSVRTILSLAPAHLRLPYSTTQQYVNLMEMH
jgi:hypothetical protein